MTIFSLFLAIFPLAIPVDDSLSTSRHPVPEVVHAVAPANSRESENAPEVKETRSRRRKVLPPVPPPPVAVVKAPGGRQVYIGPRGGRYYLTTGGNKKYLPPAIYEGEIPESSNSEQQ